MSQERVSLISSLPIPDELQGIKGVQTGFKIPSPNGARYLLCGKPGCGKSSLLHSNPKAIVLDPEMGGGTVPHPVALRFGPTVDANGKLAFSPGWEDYVAYVNKICALKNAGKLSHELFGIDTIDALVDLHEKWFCKKHNIASPGDYGGGQGAGWNKVRNSILDLLDQVYAAGFGWLVIAHTTAEVIRPKGEGEVVRYTLSLSQKFREELKQRCEHFLFLNKGMVAVKGGKPAPAVVMQTTAGGVWKAESIGEVKVRLPLPDEFVIPMSNPWSMLESEYNKAADARLNGGVPNV